MTATQIGTAEPEASVDIGAKGAIHDFLANIHQPGAMSV
jgi:hypothetical protein